MPDYYKINMLEIYKDDELIGYTECSRKGGYFEYVTNDDSDIEIDYDKYYEEQLDQVPLDKDKVLFINNQWTSEFVKKKYILDVLYHLIPYANPYFFDKIFDKTFDSLNISKIIKTQHTVMN
jgi:hypothetical protein